MPDETIEATGMTHSSHPKDTATTGNLDERLRQFLAAQGRAHCEVQPLVADASARRYYRLEGAGLLLMDDGGDPEGFSAYGMLSRHLNALGLSAPRVVQADPEAGLALVEDFGEATYARCLSDGEDEAALYRLAVEALLHLHHAPKGNAVPRPAFDLGVYLDELTLFTDWFAPAIRPDLETDEFRNGFLDLWRQALVPVVGRAETLVLRDFHVDNLMLLSAREGVARCGLLDFQDGVPGPCEYDLVSLLQDARRDLSGGLEERMLVHYIDNAPVHLGAEQDIRRRYHLLGAQRHARILGVFLRLCRRDGKPRYLQFLPRVVTQFEAALDVAELTPIRAYLDAKLPGWGDKGRALASV